MITNTKHRRQFWCDTCKQGGGPGMDGSGLIAHLEQVHKIARPFKGEKKLICALDGGDGYSNTFEMNIGGVMVCEHSSGPHTSGSVMAEPGDDE